MDEPVSRRHAFLPALGAAALPLPAAAQAAASRGPFYDVKQFGASGRKSDKATQALQAAVDAAFTAGGGTVYVPPGDYTSGPVELKSNVTVWLDAGATIFVSRDPADFPPRGTGRGRRALFFGAKVENIALTGRGRIDGQATWEWRLPPENDYTTAGIPDETALARSAGLDMRFWHKTGPLANIVSLNGATNVLIEGITAVNSSEWCMRLAECDRLFIRGVHLYSDLDRAVNSDGIDLVSSRNVVISDCILVTADDCISLKTMRNGSPIENVTVSNCVLSSSSSAFVIGVETWADIHHVVLSNSVIRNSNRGIRIAVENGAVVSDVIFSNLAIDLSRRHYNWWGSAETFWFSVKKGSADSPMGAIRNVTVDNVTSRARGTSTVLGPADTKRIENIRISNLRTAMLPENTADKRATHAVRIEGVRGLKLADVSLEWDREKAEPKWAGGLHLKDVEEFEIDSFRGRQGLLKGSAAAIVLENVADGVVRNSHAAEGCGTFLEVRGERIARLSVFGNHLSRAARKYVFEGGARREAVTFGIPAE